MIQEAVEIILAESQALNSLAQQIDENFVVAVQAMEQCTSNIIVAGVGKPFIIGQKIAASMASTGRRAFSLHPGDALFEGLDLS